MTRDSERLFFTRLADVREKGVSTLVEKIADIISGRVNESELKMRPYNLALRLLVILGVVFPTRQCPFCKREFKTYGALKYHLRRMHIDDIRALLKAYMGGFKEFCRVYGWLDICQG